MAWFICVLAVLAVIGWIDSAIRGSADFADLSRRWQAPVEPPQRSSQPVQPQNAGRRIILDANAEPISSAASTFDTTAFEGNWWAVK